MSCLEFQRLDRNPEGHHPCCRESSGEVWALPRTVRLIGSIPYRVAVGAPIDVLVLNRVGEEVGRATQAHPFGTLGDEPRRRLFWSPPGGVWVYRWPGAGPWDGEGPAHLVRGPETAPAVEKGL